MRGAVAGAREDAEGVNEDRLTASPGDHAIAQPPDSGIAIRGNNKHCAFGSNERSSRLRYSQFQRPI